MKTIFLLLLIASNEFNFSVIDLGLREEKSNFASETSQLRFGYINYYKEENRISDPLKISFQIDQEDPNSFGLLLDEILIGKGNEGLSKLLDKINESENRTVLALPPDPMRNQGGPISTYPFGDEFLRFLVQLSEEKRFFLIVEMPDEKS